MDCVRWEWFVSSGAGKYQGPGAARYLGGEEQQQEQVGSSFLLGSSPHIGGAGRELRGCWMPAG